MLIFFMCVLKAWVFNFVLLGQPVIAHFGMPRSIPAHSQNLSNLFSWSCRDGKLLGIAARSSA